MDLRRLRIRLALLLALLLSTIGLAAELSSSQHCRAAAGFLADGRFGALLVERSAIADCRTALRADPGHADLPAYLGRVLYLNKQYGESVTHVTEATRRGSVLGWVLTGVQYEYGYGRDKDLPKALAWYRRASNAGHPMGHLKVAERLVTTASTAEQKAEAIAYLKQALAAHAPGAEFVFGSVLERGHLLPRSVQGAVEAYTRGVAMGDPASMTRLAEMYLKGSGVLGDEHKAAELFARAAALNDTRAQIALGNMYWMGSGVVKDIQKAIRLYKQAAAEGDVTALRMLGFVYLGGNGPQADPGQAIAWLTQAAEAGDVHAQSQLGNVYLGGAGVKRDTAQAIHFYKLAAAQGQAFARHTLANIYTTGDGVPANQREAARWLQLAAQAYEAAARDGDATAQYQLGAMYFSGAGVPEDEAIACRWWQKAAGQHIADVHLRLAQCFGVGGALMLNLAESARQLDLASRSPLPPVEVLAGISTFLRDAAKTGNDTGVREVLRLARLAVNRVISDKTLLAEASVDSVMDIAVASVLFSDYSLGVHCLKALENAFLSSSGREHGPDSIATGYMLSYFLQMIGDENAARFYLEKTNRLVALLDRTKKLPEEKERLVAGSALYGVYIAKMHGLDDEGPLRALRYALDKPRDEWLRNLPPDILDAIARLMRARGTDANGPMLDIIRQMSQADASSDSPGLRDQMTLVTSMSGIRSDIPAEEQRKQLAALALRASVPGMMEDLRLLIYIELAKRLENAGELDQAIYFGKLAVGTSETMRSRFRPNDQSLQEKFVLARAESYRTTASLLAKAGRFVESEEVLRLLRFDELRLALRQADVGPGASGGMSRVCVGRECQTYRDQLALIEQYARTLAKLRELLTTSTPEAGAIDALISEQERLAVAWQQGIAGLMTGATTTDEQSISTQLSAIDKQSRPFASILRELGPGAVAVRYIVRKDSLLIMVQMGGAKLPTLTEVKIPEAELNKLVSNLRTAINEQRADVQVAAGLLYDVVLAPVAGLVEAASGVGVHTVLMIAPDKALEVVPFAALFDGRGYVAQRWATTNFNDASTANLKTNPGKPRLHGFGVTKAVRMNPELRYVGDELRNIAALVLAEPASLDGAFTRDKLYQTFRSYELAQGQTSIIHIASHFNLQASSQAGDTSALVLGDGSTLSLDEIEVFGMVNTELLTLSACNTAVSPVSANGEHVQSFAAIAQYKGAHAVLATLWPVNDPSTSSFMERFYRYKYANGAVAMSKAKALQLAQQDFLGPGAATSAWRHPYYWAAYTLLGNWK